MKEKKEGAEGGKEGHQGKEVAEGKEGKEELWLWVFLSKHQAFWFKSIDTGARVVSCSEVVDAPEKRVRPPRE